METIAVKALGLRDVVQGTLGVASTFDTPPSDLSNATDTNGVTTATGTGSKTTSGTAVYGYLTFDTGRQQNLAIVTRVGIWSDTGETRLYIDTSDDGTSWRLSPLLATITQTSELEQKDGFLISNCRYFRLRFYVGAATTAYAKIYNVSAFGV